jgi:DNA-binding transcriptional LysR family regulator
MRSALTGRVRVWRMRNREGVETTLEHRARIVANDPEALCRAALMGLGVAMIAVPYVERHLESGALLRLAPDWHADLGAISLYFTGQKLLPAKTRAFVDHVTAAFGTEPGATVLGGRLSRASSCPWDRSRLWTFSRPR